MSVVYKPKVSLFLDSRKEKKDGTFPVKLTVYRHPDKKRYGLPFSLSKNDWIKMNGSNLRNDQLKETKIRLNSYVDKAENIIKGMTEFSFEEFQSQMFPSAKIETPVFIKDWFDEYISVLQAEGRIGSKSSYKTSLNSFLEFNGNVKLISIDADYLKSYEQWMKKNQKSSSTIGIYLRQLRAIYNRAIKVNAVASEKYPFKRYEIPSSRNIKKALNDSDIDKILKYETEHPKKRKAVDFWLLSYLCNGMNMIDIIHLKPENIKGEYLFFSRQKTIRTKKKDLRPIKVYVSERASQIIERYRNKKSDNPFLFPVLENNLQAVTVKYRTQRFIKWINRHLDEVRADLGISDKLGTYSARHSFSTRLMRRGVSTEYIKESLGHSSVSITENYLGDFDEKIKREYAKLLTE